MAAPSSRSTSSASCDDLVVSELATASSRSSTFNTLRPQRHTVRPAHRPVASPSTPRRDHDRPGMYSFDGHHALGALGGIAYSLVNVVPPSSSRPEPLERPTRTPTLNVAFNTTTRSTPASPHLLLLTTMALSTASPTRSSASLLLHRRPEPLERPTRTSTQTLDVAFDTAT